MNDQYDATLIDRAIRDMEQPSGKDDPGHRAREALKRRATQAKHALFTFYIILTTFITVFVVGAAAFAYVEFNKPTRFVTDIRPCLFSDEGKDIRISGTREYSYPSKSFMGIDYRMSEAVTTKTKLNIEGDIMNITGISSEGWWTAYSDLGERGTLILKPADLYVFAMGKDTHVFTDKDFCK